MLIENQLQRVQLPAIYSREGKDCYYDAYRKKLIEITPEETVRQKVAKFFETRLSVPKEMMSLEVPMSYYSEGASGRADIVIHAYDSETNCIYPVMVVECKNEDVPLTDNVVDQAIRYCDIVRGKYIAITNGKELRMAAFDELTDAYIFLDEVLSYSKMVSEEYVIPNIKSEEFIRFGMAELENEKIITDYNNFGTWIFGTDTVPVLRTFAVNLYQALLDEEHGLPVQKFRTFELLSDLGQRYMDYGNAGGGHYEGIYRSFLVNDRFNETQIVSVSLFGTDSDFRGENRGSYTSLVVSVDRFKTSHNSLQYNIDRYAKIGSEGIIEFTHNGHIGSYKSKDVIEKVSEYGNCLIMSVDGIELGKLHYNKVFYLDDEEVSQFLYSLIEYALLREEVRRASKNMQ